MIIRCEETIIGENISIAETFSTRLVGLMGKEELKEDEGLLLLNCVAIHCFFMKIPIDAVYLSKDMKVLGIETIQPWRMGKHIKKVAHVLELSAGSSASKLNMGDQLIVSVI